MNRTVCGLILLPLLLSLLCILEVMSECTMPLDAGCNETSVKSVATEIRWLVFISLVFKQSNTASQMSSPRVWPVSGINSMNSFCGPAEFTYPHNSAICSILLTSFDSSQVFCTVLYLFLSFLFVFIYILYKNKVFYSCVFFVWLYISEWFIYSSFYFLCDCIFKHHCT